MPAKRLDATGPGTGQPAEQAAPPAGGPEAADSKKKKKRKKRYSSKAARDFQTTGSAGSKGMLRLANAVTVGLKTFRRSQNRSARKKRDGMMKDMMLNTARGLRDAGAEAARAPYDIYKRVDVWRQARRAMKTFTGR